MYNILKTQMKLFRRLFRTLFKLRRFFKKKLGNKFYKSLVFQSSIVFLIALEIIAVFIVYLANLNYLDSLKTSSLDKINYIRIDQEDQIKRWLFNEQNVSSEISNSSDIRLGIESLNNSKANEFEITKVNNNFKSLFERIINSNQKINSILLFDKEGKFLAYANGGEEKKTDSSDQAIQAMIRDSKLYITDKKANSVNPFFYLTIKDNQPIVAFVNPVFDSSGNRFNVVINVKTEQLNQLVINNNIKTGTDTYLIGSLNGNSFLAFGELQRVIDKENIPANLVIKNALSKQRGSGFYKNYAAMNVIGSYNWFTPLDIAIISEVNQIQALAASDRIFRNMILISTGLVILITLVFYFLVRQKIKAITKMSDIAMSISQDKFEARFPTGKNDEIGTLGISLNHMVSRFRRFRQQFLEPNISILSNESDQNGELLHSFIEITSEGFTFLDSNNLVLKINSNFAEIISNSIADSLGASYEEIFPPELVEAVKNMQFDNQETCQIKFTIPYQGNYIAILANVFGKSDLVQVQLLGKIIIIYPEHQTNDLIESNMYVPFEKISNNIKDNGRQDLSQKLSMSMVSLLSFLKLTKKKLEDTIFPKLASTDIKALKNIQQIEQNLESMIADGTQLAKSIKEAFSEDTGANKEAHLNKLAQQDSKFYVAEAMENIVAKAEKLFTSKSSNLILENDIRLVTIEINREQFTYIINLLLSRVAHNKQFRTVLVQAKVVDDHVFVVIGKVSSLLTRSQLTSILNKITNPIRLQGLNRTPTKGMGLSNIQQILDKYSGSIAVEWVDSNRESYKFYVLKFLAFS